MLILPLLPLAFAAEPSLGGGAGASSAGSLDTVRLSWDDVGFSPAAPEQVAYGPDHLAVGPDGAWAVWDPVEQRIVTSVGAFAPAGATDLAFTADGDLVVLDSRRRALERYTLAGAKVASVAFPGLVPTSVTLDVDGDVAWGVDGLGNAHPIAGLRQGLGVTDAPKLRRPAHAVERDGDVLRVDGRVVARTPGLVGGRAVGEWVVVEVRAGDHVTRSAVSLASGARVALPGDERLYRPADDLAVAPDGHLWWMDPTEDALTLRGVAP